MAKIIHPMQWLLNIKKKTKVDQDVIVHISVYFPYRVTRPDMESMRKEKAKGL